MLDIQLGKNEFNITFVYISSVANSNYPLYTKWPNL